MIAPVLIAVWVMEGNHFLTSQGVKLCGLLLRINLGEESSSVAHLATSFLQIVVPCGNPLVANPSAYSMKFVGRCYQTPVFSMEAQGSSGGSGSPLCSSSMEMLSGVRINAM